MLLKKNIVLFFIFLVMMTPSLFLNGYTLLHKSLLFFVEIIITVGVFLNSRRIRFCKTSRVVLLCFFYFLQNIVINAFLYGWSFEKVFISCEESLWWILVFLASYSLAQFNYLNVNMLCSRIIFFLFIFISSIVLYQIFFRDEIEFYTSNFAYLPLLFLPFILLIDRKDLKIACIFIVALCAIFSLKRTIIVTLFCVPVISFAFYLNLMKKNVLSLIPLVFCLVIMPVSYALFDKSMEGNLSYRFVSALDDGGSGRTEIYETVLKKYMALSFDQKMLGRGHNMVRGDNLFEIKRLNEIVYLSAHNDFIEVLYDYGFLGLMLYLYFLLQILKLCFFWYKRNNRYFISLLSSVIITICVSLSSHLVIYPTYFAGLCMLWGVMLNEKNRTEFVVK